MPLPITVPPAAPIAPDAVTGFLRGTRLLTPNGYVPVEAFKPGDPIITRLGVRRAVRWIGRRSMETGLQHGPVTIRPGAMGQGLPARPVRLSPSHAVFIHGVLVPVMHLVNGTTIRRQPGVAVTYYQIALDRHDVLMADGLAVESTAETTRLCAPVVNNGPELAQIRGKLHEAALRVPSGQGTQT